MTGSTRKIAPHKPTRIQLENRGRILNAALAIFSQHGFRGTTIDAIAGEAGMSKANLLYYFRTKNDIYVCVLEDILDQWLEPLQQLDADADPGDELWRYVQVKLQMSRNNPQASRLFATEIIAGAEMIKPFLETDLRQRVNDKCAVIQQWIDAGKLVPMQPLHLLFMIWAATQHYADFAVQIAALATEADEDQVFSDAEATLKTVLLRGILP